MDVYGSRRSCWTVCPRCQWRSPIYDRRGGRMSADSAAVVALANHLRVEHKEE